MSLLTDKLNEARLSLMRELLILDPLEDTEQKLARKIILIIEEYLFNLRKDKENDKENS